METSLNTPGNIPELFIIIIINLFKVDNKRNLQAVNLLQ